MGWVTMTARAVTTVAVASCLLAVSACATRASIDAGWPYAESERNAPRPARVSAWPLTGVAAPAETAARVQPVAVAIDNAAASRPRTGLGLADVVYEIPGRSGTRYLALFESQLPGSAGPVGRIAAEEPVIAGQYGAQLAYLGRKGGVLGFGQAVPPGAFQAGTSGTFLGPGRLAQISGTQTPASAFVFAPPTEGATITVKQVTVPFAGLSVAWTYDLRSGLYQRSVAGRPDLDRTAGRRVQAANVVVLRVKPPAGGKGWSLVGSGSLSAFSAGAKVNGSWEASADGPPSLTASDGSPVTLAPGPTWFEVVPTPVNVLLK